MSATRVPAPGLSRRPSRVGTLRRVKWGREPEDQRSSVGTSLAFAARDAVARRPGRILRPRAASGEAARAVVARAVGARAAVGV